MTQDAFTASPPTITLGGKQVTLRPMSHGFVKMAAAVSELVEDEAQRGPAIVIGFAVLNSLPPKEALALLGNLPALEEAIALADQEISLADLQAVSRYLESVTERQQEAAVTVEGPAGKDKAEATRPTD